MSAAESDDFVGSDVYYAAAAVVVAESADGSIVSEAASDYEVCGSESG